MESVRSTMEMPEDFTYRAYEHFLQCIQGVYSSIHYCPEEIRGTSPRILIRHDVDLSLQSSVRLAELEAKYGLRATYFLWPRSRFYNVFAVESIELVNRIVECGHAIGLHFDRGCYTIESLQDLEEAVDRERAFIEGGLDVKVAAISYHNPNDVMLTYDTMHVAGLVNAYSQYLREHYAYCSDSNGAWKHSSIYDVVTSDHNPRVHFLSHPGWWTEQRMSSAEKIEYVVETLKHNLVDRHYEELSKYSRSYAQ